MVAFRWVGTVALPLLVAACGGATRGEGTSDLANQAVTPKAGAMISDSETSEGGEPGADGKANAPSTSTPSAVLITGQGGASTSEPPSTGGEGELASSDCASPVSRQLAEWQPRDPEPRPVAAVLEQTRRVVVGEWQGAVTTPWTAPYAVTLRFTSDGYSAHCDQNSDFAGGSGCCRAFYYGTDRDGDLKRWTLSSVDQQGAVSGDIDIAFWYPPELGLPAWQGKLKNLDYDQTANRLRFEFWRDDGYGPVEFDLERVRHPTTE